MNGGDKVMGVIFIILLAGIGNASYGCSTRYTLKETKTKRYPIYHCTAPFGIIWIEESASGTILFIVGSYRATATLTESYNVKAFDGDELITKVFDATTVSVIPDGEFYLEEIWYEEKTYSRTGEVLGVSDSRKSWRPTHTWAIHVPQLPSLNQTISMEWTFIGS